MIFPFCYLCPRRNTTLSRHSPTIVLPERQCITTGIQKSIDHSVYAEYLKNFFHRVFAIPTQYWDRLEYINKNVFPTIESKKMFRDSLEIFSYPLEMCSNNNGLPIFLYQWDWETVESPAVALEQMRKYYFCSGFIDSTSKYQLIENLPNHDSSCIKSRKIFRAVSHLPCCFYPREFIEYIAVDEEEMTIISSSCLHGKFSEFKDVGNIFINILKIFLPSELVRGGCVYGCQFKPPRRGKKGCLVRVFQWYKLSGVIDLLQILNLSHLVDSFIKCTIQQFLAMDDYNQKEKNSKNTMPKPDFDLL